jgi:2-polyprenyl-3-methyl-5-hydroxy-6-metoxy-1,4-benzoquinol methylase
MSASRYAYRIDLDADNAHTRVIRLVGERKRVLELGCASGYMSRVLVERLGCTVTGVEVDPEAADEARKVCSRVVVADLDRLDWARELGAERFDVAVCADVLEHLRDPVAALRALVPLLAPGGSVVASIPNVAHAAVLAELLEGRFGYRPLGLLDEGHLRFFTRDSLYETFERAGLVISHLERLRLPPEATEFRTDLSRFPPAVAELLRSGEERTTYQFVLTAHPAEPGGAAVLRQRADAAEALPPAWPAASTEVDAGALWRRQVDGLLEALLARMRFLEDERARQTRELAETQARAGRLQSEVDTHLGHIEFLRAEIGHRDSQIRDLAHRIAGLEARITDLTSGVGWAMLERYRRARVRLCPPGSRRERAYVAGLRAFRAVARRRPRFG